MAIVIEEPVYDFKNNYIQSVEVKSTNLFHPVFSVPGTLISSSLGSTLKHAWIQIKLFDDDHYFVAQFQGIGSEGRKAENTAIILSIHDSEQAAIHAGKNATGKTRYSKWKDENQIEFHSKKILMGDFIQWIKQENGKYNLYNNNCQHFCKRALVFFDWHKKFDEFKRNAQIPGIHGTSDAGIQITCSIL